MVTRMRLRTRVFWIILAVASIPILIAFVGTLLPRDHVAQVAIDLQAPPDRVWALVSDVTNTARWRSDVTSVEVQPAVAGLSRWVENAEHGPTPFELVSQQPPTQQIVRIVDEGLPFGGTWTWELTPVDGGTHVAITEAGFIRNPIIRVLGRLSFKP